MPLVAGFVVTHLEVGEDVVRSLLGEQQPAFAGLELRFAATGWSNRVWRLGDQLAVRLPRRESAVASTRNEQLWLPELAERLPLAVPTPRWPGAPSARFPWPWTVTDWVPGQPADHVSVVRGQHAAEVMARFLRALHVPAPVGAPANPGRGVPLATRTVEFERRWHTVAASTAAGWLRRIWEQAVAAPAWSEPPVWLHGDLHPANVVVSRGTVSGVIDFGELCAGDPATDLAAAWLVLPAGAAARFFEVYGVADHATVCRARGWAVLRALGLIDIGNAGERGLLGGQITWGTAGWAALCRVLRDHAMSC